MLQRISLILVIVVGIAVVVVTQTKIREHIETIIADRETNRQGWTNEILRANNLAKNLNDTSNTLVQVRGELASTRQQLETTRANLAAAQSARDKLMKDLEAVRNSERAARQELAQWQALGLKPEQIKAMIEDLKKARETITVYEEEKQILNRQVRSLKSQLAKFLDPEYIVELPEGLKGKVLVVDPKWEFVVLNIGQNEGVLKDGIMMVHRDSKLVGKVRVTEVMPEKSIANIMPGWRLGDIQEGDEVLYKTTL